METPQNETVTGHLNQWLGYVRILSWPTGHRLPAGVMKTTPNIAEDGLAVLLTI